MYATSTVYWSDITSRSARVPTLSCLFWTMTLTSTGNILSIFKDGKLKAGVYKIQNLYTEGYVDIHEYSRELCCRPAQDLREGRGIVGPDLLPVVRV